MWNRYTENEEKDGSEEELIERIEALEKRIAELEHGASITRYECSESHVWFPGAGGWRWHFKTTSVTVKDALEQVMNHLGLDLIVQEGKEAVPEKLVIQSRPQTEPKRPRKTNK